MSHDEGRLNRKDHLEHPSTAIRQSFNAHEAALDVVTHGSSMIPKRFTRQVLTNDANHNTTSISFYNDNVAEITDILCVADVSGSLNNTYFVFYTGRDRVKYYVWYNVDSGGTEPVVLNATGIEVAIQSDDYAQVVALATKNAIDTAAEFYVKTKVVDGKLTITTKQGGTTTSTADTGSTGFSFTTYQNGTSELVAIIDIVYETDYDISNMQSYSTVN